MSNMPPLSQLTLAMTAIGAIAGLEACAISKGIDGTLLAGALALIAGLAGYIIPSPSQKR